MNYISYKINITMYVRFVRFLNYKDRLQPFNAPTCVKGLKSCYTDNPIRTIKSDNCRKEDTATASDSRLAQAFAPFTTTNLIQELLEQLKTHGITIEEFAKKELKEDTSRLVHDIKTTLQHVSISYITCCHQLN